MALSVIGGWGTGWKYHKCPHCIASAVVVGCECVRCEEVKQSQGCVSVRGEKGCCEHDGNTPHCCDFCVWKGDSCDSGTVWRCAGETYGYVKGSGYDDSTSSGPGSLKLQPMWTENQNISPINAPSVFFQNYVSFLKEVAGCMLLSAFKFLINLIPRLFLYLFKNNLGTRLSASKTLVKTRWNYLATCSHLPTWWRVVVHCRKVTVDSISSATLTRHLKK